jgi:hypothetical protein
MVGVGLFGVDVVRLSGLLAALTLNIMMLVLFVVAKMNTDDTDATD